MRHMYVYFFCALIFSASVVNAQTPSTISIQGVLRDGTGAAVANGPYAMSFAIYSVTTGGAALWTESQPSVIVQNGLYNVQLGSVTPFGSLAFNQQYYIGVTAGGTEMSPRITLTAAPYAMGFKGSSNVFGGSGNVGIGTITPNANLQVVGTTVTDQATINGQANIGVANIGTLNANTATLGVTTINANTTINATATIATANVGTLNASATSLGTTTINSSATISGTLAVGSSATINGNTTVTSGVLKVGGLTAALGNVGTRIITGTINSDGTILSATNDFAVTHPQTGVYFIHYNATVLGLTVTPYNTNPTMVMDFRFYSYIWKDGSGNPYIVFEDRNSSPTNIPFEFIAIVSQ